MKAIVHVDNKEIARCVTALFELLDSEDFSPEVGVTALNYALMILRDQGLRPVTIKWPNDSMEN